MASNLLKFSFIEKKIYCLSKKVGTFKVKKWDKEKHQKVETGDIKPWKFQKFSISLGKKGSQSLGFIEVQYWGDKDLEEGKLLHKAFFFLKQDKWEIKDPMTFVAKKHSKHCLIMTDFDYLISEEDSRKKYENQPKTPEECIQSGMDDYIEDRAVPLDLDTEPLEDITVEGVETEPLKIGE